MLRTFCARVLGHGYTQGFITLGYPVTPLWGFDITLLQGLQSG